MSFSGLSKKWPMDWGDKIMEKNAVLTKPGGPDGKDVFDLSKALELVDGDREFLNEIVDLFLENLSKNMGEIREAIGKSDAHALERAAHSLKGSVSNFGAKRAFDAAYRLEVVGRDGRVSEMEEALSEMEVEVRDLEAVMKGVLGEI